MAHYRIYDIDRTGRIKNGQDAECDDDAAALLIARSGMNFGTAREVWQGRRRVGCVGGGQGADGDPGTEV